MLGLIGLVAFAENNLPVFVRSYERASQRVVTRIFFFFFFFENKTQADTLSLFIHAAVY